MNSITPNNVQTFKINSSGDILFSKGALLLQTVSTNLFTAHPFFEIIPELSVRKTAYHFPLVHLNNSSGKIVCNISILIKPQSTTIKITDMTSDYLLLQKKEQLKNEKFLDEN